MRIQVVPGVCTAPKGGVRGPTCKLRVENVLRGLHGGAALLGSASECLSTNVGYFNSIEVGVKLTFRSPYSRLRLSHSIGLGHLNLQTLKLGQRQPLNVFVQPSRHDPGWRRTLATRMLPHANVVVVVLAGVLASAGARHHMTARSAAHQTGEQGRTRDGARRSRPISELPLHFVKGLEVDQRLMRRWIDVLADAQLTKVDAIPQKCPNAARGHAKAPGKLAYREAPKEVGKRRDDLLALPRVRFEPSIRTLHVAAWALSALPDTGLGCISTALVKALSMLFTLMRVDADEQVAMQSATSGAGIDSLFDGNNLAASCLNATPGPQLLGNASTKARQVGNDYPGIDATLDPLYRSKQRWPLLDWQPTGDIQLRRQNLHPSAIRLGPRFNSGNLIFIGMKAVGTPLPLPKVTDPNDGRIRLHGCRL